MTVEDRNADPSEIITVGGAAPPDWLSEYMEEDESLDSMSEYKVLSRLKILQPMTDQALKTAFGEGSVIIIPTNELIVKQDSSFKFVPVFFFAEFTKESDLKDKASDFIMARTFDHASEIAHKARNKDTRIEEYGEDNKFESRYVENLCFPGFIYGDHELVGRLVVLTFAKGEHSQGQTFVSSISLRKVPLWSQVWELNPAFRDRGEFKWWGFDFKNPETILITPDEAPAYKAFYDELKSDYKKQILAVDRSDSERAEEPVPVDVSDLNM